MASKAIYVGILVVIIIALAAAFLVLSQPAAQPSPTPSPTPSPAASPSPTPAAPAKPEKIEIPVGVLVDESGPTSDVGKDYSKGIEAALKLFNEKGIYTKDGVRVVIKYYKRDYAYNPTRAEEFYKEFRDKYGVWAVLGWGTADTEKLADQVAKDKVAYISASYSAKLVKKPYNFFPAPDYSTQACAAVKWIYETNPNAKLVLMYDHNVAYSRSPIPAIKAYAEHLGLQVAGEVHLSLKATEADAERSVREAAQYNPDYIWCGNTITSCALAVKSMPKAGLDAVFIINVWGFDERFPKLGGEAAYGRAMGVSPFRYPQMARDTEGYKLLAEAAKLVGVPEDKINLRFLQGFLNAWLLIQAIERLDSKTLMEKKGEAIKEALESSCQGEPFKFGGLAPDARYCPGRHLAHTQVWLVRLTSTGEFEFLGPISVEDFDCVEATTG